MKKWTNWAGVLLALILVAVLGAELLGVGRKVTREEAQQIAGKDLAGKQWELAKHLGERPVIVSFFATWCGPCRMEIPELAELESKYRDRGLQVVLVSEEDAATLREAGLHDAPFPVLPNMGSAFRAFNVNGIPRTLYFDRTGKLAKDLEGYSPKSLEKIGKELEALPVSAAR